MKHTLTNTCFGIILMLVLIAVFPWAVPVAAAAGVWHFIGWMFKRNDE